MSNEWQGQTEGGTGQVRKVGNTHNNLVTVVIVHCNE